MRIQVLLPILGIILITVFICRLHRPLPAPAPQETISHFTLKNENHPKSKDLNAVAEAVPSLTLEEWSRQTTIATTIANIRQTLNSTNEADQKEIVTHLFPMLLSLDPAAAAALAQNVGPVPLREELLRQVARSWSQTDPARALEWASSLNDPGERANTLTLICSGVAQTNPSAAMADAQQAGLDQDTGAMESLVQTWAAHDLNGALAWAAQLPASNEKDQMLARLAFNQVQSDPAHAAMMVAEQISPGSVQDEAAMSVLHQWALRDPTAAAAWLQQFPAGSLHNRGEQELAGIATINN